MADEVIEDKQSETPETTGEVSEAPPAPEPEEVLREVIEAEEKAAPETAAPEGTEDGQEEVVQGADDTAMAPVDDPVIKALTADPRFEGAKFKTAKELFDSIHNLRTKMSQRDEDAVLGREARGSWDAFKQFEQGKKDEEKGLAVWNPPPMPIGMHAELQKAPDDRDPVKVEEYNKRLRYMNDHQTRWAEDPDLQLREHTLPAVERLVGEMFAMRDRRTSLETYVDKHETYVNKHGAEIREIMNSEGAPLKLAIEISQLRRGTKPAAAAEAREADATSIAGRKRGPRASAPEARAPEEEVNPLDPAAIMRAELAKGPVDTDPLSFD